MDIASSARIPLLSPWVWRRSAPQPASARGRAIGGTPSEQAFAAAPTGRAASSVTAAISVFDLDRTLTIRPTYSAFLLGATRARAAWRLLLIPLLLPCALPYACGLLSRRRMKEAMHRLMLGARVSRAELERLAEAFAARVARDGIYPQALELLAAEIAAGRRVMLATAAPSYYAAPLARMLGIEDVVATGQTWVDDRLTHRIARANCHGASKQRMLARHLAANGWERDRVHLRFFSDDLSDLPTFEWCDDAVAVNPSPALRREAARRGWPTLDWRRARSMRS